MGARTTERGMSSAAKILSDPWVFLGIDDVGPVGCGHFMGYLLGYDYGMYFTNDNIYIIYIYII
jgi:hypothetical protein